MTSEAERLGSMSLPEPSEPSIKACRVSVPCRTSISVLDMNGFSPGVAGGGNIGFALDIRTEVLLTRRRPGKDAPPEGYSQTDRDQSALIQNACEIWEHETRLPADVDVVLEQTVPSHIGLGSSGTLQLAVLLGLNRLHGYPLPLPRLRRVLSDHYKEAHEGRLIPGFTTGLSSFLALHGGFAILGDVNTVLFHKRTPRWTAVFAIPSAETVVSFGDSEAELLMQRGRACDRLEADKKMRIVRDSLIPAVSNENLPSIGEAVRSIQNTGSKKEEVLWHGAPVTEALHALRDSNIECSFLSAVGPGVALISASDVRDVERVCATAGLIPVYSGSVDSEGARISSID